jgi:MFS family permease
MKEQEIKKKNVKNLLIGVFFISFSYSFTAFFLPFFLKEKGLSAFEIGGLFTLSIAVSSLLLGVVFSKILRKVKLKSGLILSAILSFFRTFVLYLFPNVAGASANQILDNLRTHTSRISIDTTFQHNTEETNKKKLSSLWMIIDSLGITFGIATSIVLINQLGFNLTFLIFSIIPLFALFFHSRINEEIRFKPNPKFKLPKISKRLKLILFAEIIYWFALASSFSLVITFLVAEKFSGTLLEMGIIFLTLYVTITLTTFITKAKLNKFNEVKTSIVGMVFLLISAIVVILSQNFYIILIAFFLEGVGAGIWVPSKTVLQWGHTEKENREKVSGWLSGFKGFVSALGPLAGGFLITSLGINAPFYLKAGISVVSLLVYFYILRSEK